MNGLFWIDGHLAWPFFVSLIFTGGIMLAADIVWRVVTMPARQLLAAVFLFWLLGLVAIYMV